MGKIKVEPVEDYGLSQRATPKTQFQKVGVIGCGRQGSNIIRMLSAAGMDVVFIETTLDNVKAGLKEIEGQLMDMINRWGMTESEMRSILTRIHGSTQWNELKGTDLVVEAVRSTDRDMRVKMRKDIFKKIENHVSPQTIIATNSTTLAITELAADLKHKERCLSLHFSTNSPEANIIEVARSIYTSDEVCAKIRKFATLVKQDIISSKESAGLISVRLLSALLNEACELYMQGISSIEDIDRTMRVSLGLRFGPFEVADKIGIDRVLRWMDNLYSEFGDKKFKASPLIRRLVRAKQLGRTTGSGFYIYDGNGKRINNRLFNKV